MDQPASKSKKISPWELLKEEDVSPSKYFPVWRQTVKIHNDIIIDDYFIDKLPDASMVVVITNKKELVMVRQYRQGISQITLELPAGVIDNADPLEAAKRELLEETGIEVTELMPLGIVATSAPKSKHMMHGYFSTSIKNEVSPQNLDQTENIEIVKVPIKEIDSLILSGEINCADTISFIVLARLKSPETFLV